MSFHIFKMSKKLILKNALLIADPNVSTNVQMTTIWFAGMMGGRI